MLIKRILLSSDPAIEGSTMTISTPEDEKNTILNKRLVINNNIDTIIISGTVETITSQEAYRLVKKFEVKAEKVETLPDYAFYNSLFIETFIPGNIKTIGQSAFLSSTLSSINFDKIEVINQYAFDNCYNLPKDIELTAIKELGAYTFSNSNIESIHVAGGTEISNYFAYNCYQPSKVTISSTITTIGDYAFCQCRKLTSFDFTSITEIKQFAFYNSGLEQVEFNAIATIHNSAFSNSNIKSISFKEQETGTINIELYSFASCYQLTDLKLPKNAKITYFSFDSCISLKTVTATLDVVAGFSNCSSLESFTNNYKQTDPSQFRCSILQCAFYKCSKLKSINLAEVGYVDDYAFAFCTSLESIGDYSFSSVGRMGFAYCKSLVIDKLTSVSTIGELSFTYCTSIKTMTITGTRNINKYAFAGCTNLETLFINVTETTTINYPDLLYFYHSPCNFWGKR
ncbi:surface antigen BspA-like [Trichomonas vaginalis G3]|uniref:Surface antigen BspA-like n=1 Tax=Trichomonas vaginalis (strain ATCC PRA-98 / G3) TaxID=412133 RepID=A2G2L6_TRIV3|nr:ribonuclease inhibitor domain-containing protein [Trichomonas vaginalis G3]EAX88601.1 surface antigen BspA-like [Trichomonas vaginalis G3]KAI5531295.1 ribonuclease inhibitor domain-containing protein [Trichomonas vaginalis G3]|eukprot:XP_001301531.1 surface antigen BspA-like [Trichomonas vaginalis G3]